MRTAAIPAVVGLLLAVVVPVALGVKCYECYGEDVSVDSADKGDLKCLTDPESLATKECPGDFCGKLYWKGTASGTTDGVSWTVDVEGVSRGCDENQECTDGAELSYLNHEAGYPDIKTTGSCSRGDLSNSATTGGATLAATLVAATLALASAFLA